MKKTIVYGFFVLMLVSLASAIDCSSFDYKSKLVIPEKPIYLVTDRASWTFEALTVSKAPTCKVYAPTLSELLAFKRKADYSVESYGSVKIYLQRDRSFDIINQVSFTDVFKEGKGLYQDIMVERVVPLKCKMNNVTSSLIDENGTETNTTSLVRGCWY